MGMGGDEMLSERATSKYQVQFLSFAFSLNFFTMKPENDDRFLQLYKQTNNKKGYGE